jgi:hypothetical protein
MNFIINLVCNTLLDSLYAESLKFAKSKGLKTFFRFTLTIVLVAVLVTALFGFIINLGGLKK